MIGIVVVSHSRRLAEAAVELALQMVHGTRPAIEIAAGLDGGVLGTDAADVWGAIQRAATPDGVLSSLSSTARIPRSMLIPWSASPIAESSSVR